MGGRGARLRKKKRREKRKEKEIKDVNVSDQGGSLSRREGKGEEYRTTTMDNNNNKSVCGEGWDARYTWK